MPNDAAIVRLVTAVCVETHDEWAVAERRYLSEESMAKPQEDTKEEAPLAITASHTVDVDDRTGDVDLHHSAGRGQHTPEIPYRRSGDCCVGACLANAVGQLLR